MELWTRFKESIENLQRAIMPESHAEAAVADMMRTPAIEPWYPEERGYDPEDYSSPNIYVAAKGELKSIATKGLAGIGIFILAAIVVYALAPAIVGRFLPK